MLPVLAGHVESAVWRAWARDGGTAPAGAGPVATAVREAAAVLTSGGDPGRPRDLPSWTALLAGDGDWAELLDGGTAHPAERHVGTAALLYATRTGVVRALLRGSVGGPAGLLGWGERDGWATPDRSGWTATDALRALSGNLPDPAAWIEARLGFEAEWFWAPLGELCERTGPAAFFGAPGRAGRFRAASARMNRIGTPLRERAASAVARAIGEPARTLELGAVSPVWGAAWRETHRTVVDYAEVLAESLTTFHPKLDAVAADPLRPPPGGPFDVVVVDELLHTAPTATATEVLAGAVDRLAPGGLLVVVEPLLDDDRGGPVPVLSTQVKVTLTGGGRIWSAGELRTALRALGLRPAQPRTVAGSCVSVARR